jgi:hypothetical protein
MSRQDRGVRKYDLARQLSHSRTMLEYLELTDRLLKSITPFRYGSAM